MMYDGLNDNYINYNLQFFAKDGPGGEKTEQPTAKKLSDARNEGQVAKSKDLTGAVSLLASFIILKVYIGYMGQQFVDSFKEYFTRAGELFESVPGEINTIYVQQLLISVGLKLIILVGPFMAVALVSNFVIDLIQVKWKITTKPLKPKLSKFNPINGFKRIFSVKTIVQLIKQILIIVLIVIIIYNKIKNRVGDIYKLYDIPLNAAIVMLGDIIFDLGMVISAVYVVIGITDYVYEKLKFKKDMMMTKQEVKEEWKNTEGSPEVKQKQRQKMQEASRRRMMQAIPEADVVITNPTHFAVALKYEKDQGKAPVVVAKGADYLAAKIKEIAKESNVEIVENKPLARMLYHNVEIGEEIPPELYQAVAEVLAFVYNLKNR